MVFNMNNESMANFICELRKSKNMTQKQLAEKLNITDKAVSKWERGLGYPDISILSPLAEVLGVTTNELLNGKRSIDLSLEANEIVETTLQYANKVTLNKMRTAKIIISLICFLGIFICMICDIAISSRFTWSLYSTTAISFAWLIIIPFFQFQKNKVFMSLVSLSTFIIPFLFILNKIIGDSKFMLTLGILVSLIVIIYMWGIYILLSIKKAEKLSIVSISILLAIPVCLLINFVVAKFTNHSIIDMWDILSCGLLGLVSIILFFIAKKKQ